MKNQETYKKLKSMRLSGWIESWDRYMGLSKDTKYSFEALLTEMITEEFERKRDCALQRRIQRAKFKEGEWHMATFPFKQQPKLNRRQVLAEYDSLKYIEDHKNLIWIGPTGCGKTGLATSFIMQGLEKELTGRFVDFADLMHELYQAAADHSEKQTLKPYLHCDLLLIDEVGYIEAEPAQVGLFFKLLHHRHKKASTLITSNLGFQDWGGFLKNDHLTAALIDRLTENCEVFDMSKCSSLRRIPKETS